MSYPCEEPVELSVVLFLFLLSTLGVFLTLLLLLLLLPWLLWLPWLLLLLSTREDLLLWTLFCDLVAGMLSRGVSREVRRDLPGPCLWFGPYGLVASLLAGDLKFNFVTFVKKKDFHCRIRIRTRIPNPMDTWYYAEVFPLHRLRLGFGFGFRFLSWMVTVPILGTDLHPRDRSLSQLYMSQLP